MAFFRNLLLAVSVATAASALLAQEKFSVRPGEIMENVECLADPTQTYTLYLPRSYDHETPVPVLLIFDPRSRGTFAANIFVDAAEKYGWMIMSSNGTMSDGPPEPNQRALNALWPEMSRYAIDPDRIYAAGFSGGGMLTLVVGLDTGELAGVIEVGGRLPEGISLQDANFAHYGAAARLDFNFTKMREIDRIYEDLGLPHRLDHFDGRHSWFDRELAGVALGWLELVAMGKGDRASDDELLAELWAHDMKRGEQLEESGQVLEAYRHYEMMSRTYEGLRSLDVLDQTLRRMKRSAGIERLEKDERRAERYEQRALLRMARALVELARAESPVAPTRFRAALGVDDLLRDARRTGAEGEAAQRVLESMFSQTSFYFNRDFFRSGEMSKAVLVLEIATEIHPELWPPRYNLACAYARLGRHERALAQLEAAIEHGFSNYELLASDEDLRTLRESARFASLLERLQPVP